MATVPKKITERLAAGLKKFQPILTNARTRDDGEADTVTIVKDMLAEIFGYDKYTDITGEFAIRGTYCDLAIKLEGTLQTLIEVKAVGIVLKASHVKQAVDYAANQGVDWVMLTNGDNWRLYKVHFTKPIDCELVADIHLCALNARSAGDIELLYLLCKEGWARSVVGDYYEQKQALSRYFVGAAILTDGVLKEIRQTLRRLSPNIQIDAEHIRNVVIAEVIKREVLEGDKAQQAKSKIQRTQNKAAKAKKEKDAAPPIAEHATGLPKPESDAA